MPQKSKWRSPRLSWGGPATNPTGSRTCSSSTQKLGSASRECPSDAFVTEERLSCCFQFFSPLGIHFGIRKVQPIERIDDDCGHGQAGEPFVVRGDDQPGCMGRSSVRDHLFVGVHVVIPVLALLEVGGRKFPVLFRLLQAVQESFLLLFL